MIDHDQDYLLANDDENKPQEDPEEVRRRGEESRRMLEKLDWHPFDVEW